MENNKKYEDVPQWEAKRTTLWKLCNAPPIIFRLALYLFLISFFIRIGFQDIALSAKIEDRCFSMLLRILTILLSTWTIDCLVRIQGFTNAKTLLIYEIVKAIIEFFCILFITITLIYLSYYAIPLFYFLTFIGIFAILKVKKLYVLSHVIENYDITTINNIDTLTISSAQSGLETGGAFIYYFTYYLDYQIEINSLVYRNTHMLDGVIRHKFADYKNGKPLRIISSTKNPKFNIIFQD